MQHHRLLVLFMLLANGAYAQWLNFPTPGTPRTRDGKPNLDRSGAARLSMASPTSPVCGGMRSRPLRN